MKLKIDAFISYRRDGGFLMAQMLRGALKDKGVNCYLDLEEDHPGQFDESLLDAIGATDNFILVLTKGTLDRCVNQDDWVRKEILAAINGCKNIIPVRYPDFEWPKHLNEKLPKEIQMLETKQSVLLSQEYLSSTIDKIIQYMIGVNDAVHYEYAERIKTDTAEFFKNGFDKLGEISCIDLFFRAGSEWHHKAALVDILLYVIENKINMRVIVNAEETVGQLSVHMRQPLKKYYGYGKSLQDWIEKARGYPDIISVKVADVPLMHRYYCMKGKKEGIAKVSFYTYGNYASEKDFQFTFSNLDDEYQLYEEEFEYLWNKVSHVVELC